ncbi:MAG: hypothetical protein WD795_12900 [Woeseia sp.]
MFATGSASHSASRNKKTKGLVFLALSFLFVIPASVFANPRYVQLDLSSHFNQNHGPDEYGVFVSSLPEGLVTFSSHVPFQFSREHSVIVQNNAASLTIDAVRAKAVHLLINVGFALTAFLAPGERLGKITLVFDKGQPEITHLVIGANIREWRQVGDCGATVNTLTHSNANVEVTGKAPNACDPSFTQDGTGLAVIDRLTVPVRRKGRTLTGIVVEDLNPFPAAIVFSAITVEVAPK